MNSEKPSVKILTDVITHEPMIDFESYGKTIIRIVMGSEPRFSIGIFGEGGAGKTTLMRLILDKLQYDTNVVTVWFNAWKAVGGEAHAAIPFLNTIRSAIQMLEPETRRETIWSKVSNGLARTIKALVESSSLQLGANSKSEGEDLLNLSNIYSNAIAYLESSLRQLREQYADARIVVFIDDIDRCTPQKVLELLELRSLLDIEGFVFIIGLNPKRIVRLIEIGHGKETGIRGEQYLEELIQVPINLPQRTIFDIKIILRTLAQRLDEKYSRIILENIELIAIASGSKPSDAIRFINSFIVSYEVHSSSANLRPTELLAVHGLRMRWNGFYEHFISKPHFRDLVREYVEMSESDREKNFDSLESIYHQPHEPESILLNYRSDVMLWDFLFGLKDTIFGIERWEIYQRALSI